MHTPSSLDITALARRLAAARQPGAARLPTAQLPVADAAQAAAVQEATLALLGPPGGWKVGAGSPQAEPGCAPLPAGGLHASGVQLARPDPALRGIELEVAVRLGRDLPAPDGLPSAQAVAAAVEALLPAIELVDSRLDQGLRAPAWAQSADLGNHDALVLGAPVAMDLLALDLAALRCRVLFDATPVADTTGHPSGDLVRLLAWLAREAQARGRPLAAGDVITLGSCTGLQHAPPGTRVRGEIAGLGAVELRL